MKDRAHPSFRRACGVVLLLAAWLVLSNHCAITVLRHHAPAAQAVELPQCCAQKAPVGKEKAPQDGGGVCCKSLRVLAQEVPVQWVKAQDPMQLFELLWVALIPVPEAGADRSEVAWSGSPQELWSFAEVVLQRSLRSHAPPSAA